MKPYHAISILGSFALHLICLVAGWLFFLNARAVEVAIQRGGIVLEVVMARSPEDRQQQHWHIHAPLLPSDHTHRHGPGEIVWHAHESWPRQPTFDGKLPLVAFTETRRLATEFELPQPATVASAPPVESPPVESRRLPRAAASPARLAVAEVEPPVAPASRRNARGARVDEWPRSLPQNSPPEYPAAARAQRHIGVVVLSVLVNSEGNVERLTVESSSGHAALDHSALAAVRRWQFSPARLAGQPIATTVRVPVRFSIRD